MTAPPRIDVIVPARDAAATLPACLESLRAAGFAAAEVTVVDDGSTDGTAAIARGAGVRLVAGGGDGAATARNRGAAASPGADVLLFVDADVVLHPGARGRVERFFLDHPGHAGVIGSYDAAPPAPGRLSRIRNLMHHHAHQRAGGDVPSFWTGCGAIRVVDFEAAGGFEPGHPLEDVALGLALARAGRRVRLDADFLCTHLKRWTLASMIRTDLFHRALPWSRMLLDPGNAAIPAALNAGRTGRLSVGLAGIAVPGLLAAPVWPVALIPTALAAAGLAWANGGLLALVARRLGPASAALAVAVLWIHFLCAGTGFAWALLERVSSRGGVPGRSA